MDRSRRWRWGDALEPLRETITRGGVLALPTESSYALGADPWSREGVRTVFRCKRRPPGQPLPVVISSIDMLVQLGVELPREGLRGLERGWPGPLSLLLRCAGDPPAAAGSGRLAVRVPGHERLRKLLGALGMPLTATSANPSGRPALVDPEAAGELLEGEDAMIVDDGRLPGGAPSTLVALRAGRGIVMREGRVSRLDLERIAPDWFSAEPVEIPVEESR